MKELRNIDQSLTSENRHIAGYALLFDSASEDLGGFIEVIDRSSLDGVIEASDVFAVLDHDIKRGVLARSNRGKGSMTLTVDDKGLKYEFDAPKTALGDELIESITRGDISTSSFRFVAEKDKWERRSGKPVRRIMKFREIYDVSPVYQPAYSNTTVIVDTRGLDNFLADESKDNSEYYKQLRNGL